MGLPLGGGLPGAVWRHAMTGSTPLPSDAPEYRLYKALENMVGISPHQCMCWTGHQCIPCEAEAALKEYREKYFPEPPSQ